MHSAPDNQEDKRDVGIGDGGDDPLPPRRVRKFSIAAPEVCSVVGASVEAGDGAAVDRVRAVRGR